MIEGGATKQKHGYRVVAVVVTLAAIVATFVVIPYSSHGYGNSNGYIPHKCGSDNWRAASLFLVVEKTCD